MRILLTSVLFLGAFASVAGAASTRPQGAAIGHPTSPAKIVLRISSGGGFVTPQTNLRALPSFTLYGDGTVIVPGVITQMYPGPAIYPLIRSKLRESQVQALLRSAAHAGLLARGPIDYGTVGVTDMPTTTLLLNAGGRHVERQAYALGATGGSPLPARQARARKALMRFIAGLPHGVSGARYVPRALAVYVAPSDGQAQPGASAVVWPLQAQPGNRREARAERAELPLHLRGRRGCKDAPGHLAQRQRGVALEHAREPRQALPADRAPVVAGRGRLCLARGLAQQPGGTGTPVLTML